MRGWNSKLKESRIGWRLLVIERRRRCRYFMKKVISKNKGPLIWKGFNFFWFKECINVSRQVRLVQKSKKILICKLILNLWELLKKYLVLQIPLRSSYFLKKSHNMIMKRFSLYHKKPDLNHLMIFQGLIWILRWILTSRIGNTQDQ